MASRNILRQDIPDGYYHVYGRGVNKSNIFKEGEDKDYFLYLLSRHLSIKPVISRKAGYKYPHYRGQLELLSFCVMDNHFHLLFYQNEQGAVSTLMHSVLIAYTRYFNQNNGRNGPLFESRYKSSLVDKDSYLLHISRYIHLNPRSWKRYRYSSIVYITKATEPEWLQTEKLMELHVSRAAYLEFLADYEDHKKILSDLKHQIANF